MAELKLILKCQKNTLTLNFKLVSFLTLAVVISQLVAKEEKKKKYRLRRGPQLDEFSAGTKDKERPIPRAVDEVRRSCYTLKKHPSATFVPYKARVCPDPDKNKKVCPPPIEVCKDPDVVDICAKKKRRQASALTIDDVDIKVIPRGKPPKCPSSEDPCANDGVVKPQVCKVEEPRSCGNQDDD